MGVDEAALLLLLLLLAAAAAAAASSIAPCSPRPPSSAHWTHLSVPTLDIGWVQLGAQLCISQRLGELVQLQQSQCAVAAVEVRMGCLGVAEGEWFGCVAERRGTACVQATEDMHSACALPACTPHAAVLTCTALHSPAPPWWRGCRWRRPWGSRRCGRRRCLPHAAPLWCSTQRLQWWSSGGVCMCGEERHKGAVSDTAALQQHCSSTAAALQQHCSSTAAALQQHCRKCAPQHAQRERTALPFETSTASQVDLQRLRSPHLYSCVRLTKGWGCAVQPLTLSSSSVMLSLAPTCRGKRRVLAARCWGNKRCRLFVSKCRGYNECRSSWMCSAVQICSEAMVGVLFTVGGTMFETINH